MNELPWQVRRRHFGHALIAGQIQAAFRQPADASKFAQDRARGSDFAPFFQFDVWEVVEGKPDRQYETHGRRPVGA